MGRPRTQIKTSDGVGTLPFEIKTSLFAAIFIWEQEIGGSNPPAPTKVFWRDCLISYSVPAVVNHEGIALSSDR